MAIIKEFKELMDYSIELLQQEYTKEEALKDLYLAGILDKDGNFTKPYKNLGKFIRDNQEK